MLYHTTRKQYRAINWTLKESYNKMTLLLQKTFFFSKLAGLDISCNKYDADVSKLAEKDYRLLLAKGYAELLTF